MVKNKIGIVVPYRNRREHLNHFIPSISNHLKKQKIPYEIIVVEQADDKPFNRGKLLNIGVERAKKLKCTYVALHDVDMLPMDVDYSYVNRPTHLATNFVSDSTIKSLRTLLLQKSCSSDFSYKEVKLDVSTYFFISDNALNKNVL